MSKWSDKKGSIEFIIHVLVWIILFYIPVALTYGTESSLKDIALHFWLQLGFLALVFYLNYLWLVDRYLFNQGRRVLFVLINIAVLVILYWSKYEIFTSMVKPGGKPGGPPLRLVWFMDFFIYLIPIAFAIAIKAGKRLTGMEVYKAEAENIKLQAELSHLKFQLQPHFFFNALNNIYSLVETDPDKARQSIHSMSKLMRHLLQASEASSTTLAEEIDFLRKYISLMQVRLTGQTKIEMDFPENVPFIEIAPLLFISIVENAFKHGISATQPSTISFLMQVSPNGITFTSRNRDFSKSSTDLSGSGIGLENLRKRLALLYPGRHQFTTRLVDHNYEAVLQLHLK